MVERHNGYLETSFLPGRTSPRRRTSTPRSGRGWPARANTRTVRSIQGRPVDAGSTVDYRSMLDAAASRPHARADRTGPAGRDYYVRVDTVDYSVDPRRDRPVRRRHRLPGRGRRWPATASSSPATTAPGPSTAVVTDPSPRRHRAARCAKPSPCNAGSRRPPPATTPTATPSPCGPCPTTTPSSASTSTPLPPTAKASNAVSTATKARTTGHGPRRDAVDDRLPHPGAEDPHHRRGLGRARRPRPATRTGHTRSTWPRLLQRQVADRESKGTVMRIRTAHFPQVKTLEDFNLDHLPSLRRDRPRAPGHQHLRRQSRERDPARPARDREDPPGDRPRRQGRPVRLLGPVRHRQQLDHPPRRPRTRPGNWRPS